MGTENHGFLQVSFLSLAGNPVLSAIIHKEAMVCQITNELSRQSLEGTGTRTEFLILTPGATTPLRCGTMLQEIAGQQGKEAHTPLLLTIIRLPCKCQSARILGAPIYRAGTPCLECSLERSSKDNLTCTAATGGCWHEES